MRYITPSTTFLQRTRLLLTIIFGVSLVAGIISAFEFDSGVFDWRGLLGNLSTEMIGGVITFILIDQFITRNQDETSKRNILISQLENPDAAIVKRTVQELRALGWLADGSLYGWFLKGANFSGIDLRDFNMNGLGLYRCNLTNAKIADKQLVQLNDLRRCTMPDGSFYDGRYCLSGDVEWAKAHHSIDFMSASIEEMADYYEVDVETFMEGQRWASQNLDSLGHEMPPYMLKMIKEEKL